MEIKQKSYRELLQKMDKDKMPLMEDPEPFKLPRKKSVKAKIEASLDSIESKTEGRYTTVTKS